MYWQAGRRKARIKRDVWISGISVAMTLQELRKMFEPALRRIFHLYWRFARGMTLGVRGVVLDGEDRVFQAQLCFRLAPAGRRRRGR